ncbi:hypothetical protein QAD02_008681 [Eretmocerus hayati]|uniref:Uncharacterized protein n=1 Tax=Eretmocerus hayati TaxID=131215 RepID=A0ACC2N7I5_9HYME|nr:hypothetical protein QAD02_008681 [Eretmocerus hayati]
MSFPVLNFGRRNMGMIYFLVTCFLLVEVTVTSADQETQTNSTDFRDSKDFDFTDSSPLIEDDLPELQRRRDFGYYHSRLNRYTSGNYRGPSSYNPRGRFGSRPQSQIRPPMTYGPPNYSSSSFSQSGNRPAFSNFMNQDTPNPFRQVEFVEKSPIASQNDIPFGRNTAKYLPPRNQKLPAQSPPHLFSNQNHDFTRFRQPLQPQAEQFFQQPQAQTQFQNSNQNFNGPDFNRLNFDAPPQNAFQSQQISDAALFLAQNAQAISSLYGAPATNQNYAPYNQEFPSNNVQAVPLPINQIQFQPINQPSFSPSQQINQPTFNQQIRQENFNQQVSQQNFNEQPNAATQVQDFLGHIPNYASGVLSLQETRGNLEVLERERIIAQLQQALSNRENAARAISNLNGNGDSTDGANGGLSPQFLPLDESNNFNSQESNFDQPQPSFLSTSSGSSNDFQGYYVTSSPGTTPNPIVSTQPSATTVTFESGLDSSGTMNSQNEANSFFPIESRPNLAQSSESEQYRGFLPTFVPSAFVPNIPTFGTFIPTPALKPDNDAPTHFVLPLPGSQGQQKPANLPSNFNPVSQKPPTRPGTPTITIPLGPVNTLVPPLQTVASNPGPTLVPVAPIQPVFGSQLPTLSPPIVFKPGKVYPVYYYPNFPYQSTQRSSDTSTMQPWNYAPNFAQRRRRVDS